MPNRWQVIVECTLDIKDGDNVDVVQKRTKLLMGQLITDEGIVHYHIVQRPKVVFEFD